MKLVSALALATSTVALPAAAVAMTTCKTDQRCEKEEPRRPVAKETKAERVKGSPPREASEWCQDGDMLVRCEFGRVPMMPFN